MKSSCAIFVLAILASISSLPQHSLAQGGIDPGVTAMVAFENADAVRVRSNANRFAVVTVSPGLREEGPGILNFFIAGLDMLLEGGRPVCHHSTRTSVGFCLTSTRARGLGQVSDPKG